MANRWKYMGHEIGGWVSTNPEPTQKLVFKLDKHKWIRNGQYARLPEHYKRRAIEHLYGDKEDVHEVREKRKFIVNHETGVWTRTQHVPVTVVPTVQADKGLWGGEGVLIGYEEFPVVNDYHRCFISVPKLMKLLLYNHMIFPPSPPRVDESKLFALHKVVETIRGEIYIGKYAPSIDVDSKCVLIKIVKTNAINASRQVFLNELDVLSSLHHNNIVLVCAVQLDLLYLVQEHSDFGTLQDYSRTLSHPQQTNDPTIQKLNICFAYQLVSALQHLADLAIVHGDVATRNCLFFSDYTIKLTDCAMALPQYAHEYWSCPNGGQQIPLRWLAPEALTTCPTNKSDVYSFAVTLWELWSRCSSLPHGSLTHEELYQHILMQQSSCHHDDFTFALSVPPDCPKEIYDLLCECWHSDGLKRPNIGDIALYFRRHVDACRLVTI